MAAKSVSVLILLDEGGKILLQHRTSDAPIFPDYWAFFGGGIEADETPEQALKREALEELDYHIHGYTLFNTHTFPMKGAIVKCTFSWKDMTEARSFGRRARHGLVCS